MMGWVFLLFACNATPLDWRSYGLAPDAVAPWGYPSDAHCTGREPGAVEIDGFFLCENTGPTPIDDPIFSSCDDPDVTLQPGEEVFYVFDGLTAKAWPLLLLDSKREIFHDVQGGVEIVGLF